MKHNLAQNAVNQVSKGTIIYELNESVNSVVLILKGRVKAYNQGANVVLGSGSFLGLSDYYRGNYLNTYEAYDDVTFYCFSLEEKEELEGPFLHNNDYKGLAISSMIRYVNEINVIYEGLRIQADKLYSFISNQYEEYMTLGKELGYDIISIQEMKDLKEYSSEYVLDSKKVSYYKDCGKINLEQWKSYCGVGSGITPYMIEEMALHINSIMEELFDLVEYNTSLFYLLIHNERPCLFKNYATLCVNIQENGASSKIVIHVIDDILEHINYTEKLMEEKTGTTLMVNRKKMEEIYYLLLSSNSNKKEQAQTNFRFTMEEQTLVETELKGTLNKILYYSQLDIEVRDTFIEYLDKYRGLRDKNSLDDSIRLLRKRIAEIYYPMYERVFFRAVQEKNPPKAVLLFLKYGLLDETFLTADQLKELFYLEDEESNKKYSNVYNIYDWLKLIYEGRKEPSKNEFDLDYTDNLRQQKKRGDITEAEEKVLLMDQGSKVTYEIHNMFRYNNRVVNGSIGTFVPFLHGDAMIQNVKKLMVSSQRINQALEEILKVDYSLFYREGLYVNEEANIQKEYIMEEIYPDIILMPTVGRNGIMWQEISGKRKNTSGRFLMAQFNDGVVQDLLLKLCARFRWELCRSIQGAAWNNTKYKSLTSEYSDYLQFYRKNKEISPEVKEKIKAQILKGKGNYREVFVLDYETWVKNESSGAIRLNRVAREIIATYCPFERTLRQQLQNQPIFVDAMSRVSRENLKKVKEIEQKYRHLEKEGGIITKELKDTLVYYKEL